VTIDLRKRGIRAILLDIEGTTTRLAFVHEVLFPYARTRLRDYLSGFVETPEGRDWRSRLRAEWDTDVASGAAPPQWKGAPLEAALAYCVWLMDRDRKSPELKRLQGWIWERGYRAGELTGEVFPDVPRALARWRAAGIDAAIYSSGSVLAQKLLFGQTQLCRGSSLRLRCRRGAGRCTNVRHGGRPVCPSRQSASADYGRAGDPRLRRALIPHHPIP
jgi:2,3-diketo-5-methylthio-1-phosphopentane phosphatase